MDLQRIQSYIAGKGFHSSNIFNATLLSDISHVWVNRPLGCSEHALLLILAILVWAVFMYYIVYRLH